MRCDVKDFGGRTQSKNFVVGFPGIRRIWEMRRNECKIRLAQSAGLNLTNESSVYLYVPKKKLLGRPSTGSKSIFGLYNSLGGASCTRYVSNHTLSPAALRNMFVVHSTLLNIILWPPSSHLSTVSIMLGLDSVAVCNIISA